MWTGLDSVSPTTCGCDLTWKWGLYRCHQAKRRSQTQHDWHPHTKNLNQRDDEGSHVKMEAQSPGVQ